MVTPSKHPGARSRQRDGKNKSVVAFERGLKPLSEEVPKELTADFSKAGEVWTKEIVPLIQRGVLKETDYTSCVTYCQLAVVPILKLPARFLPVLKSLRTELGLTPKARTNLVNTDAPKANLAEVMRLRSDVS